MSVTEYCIFPILLNFKEKRRFFSLVRMGLVIKKIILTAGKAIRIICFIDV